MTTACCAALRAEWAAGAAGRGAAVAARDPACACETGCMEIHAGASPGPVATSETIARLIFSPQHLDDDGKVTEGAFSDVKTIGLSVQRVAYSDHPDLIRVAAEIEAKMHERGNREATCVGMLTASAQAVRAITGPHAEARAFCVYDTAKQTNRAHADVIQPQIGGASALKRLRKRLRDVFLEASGGVPIQL